VDQPSSPSPVAPAKPAASWRGKLGLALKWSYALGTGALSVWIVSFAPGEGPSASAFLPKNATAAVLVRRGEDLLHALPRSERVRELLNDPDLNALYSIRDRREKFRSQYAKAPVVARWLFPDELSSLFPLIGRDFVIASVALAKQDGQDGAAEKSRRTPQPLLFITRLSGARGQLIRMGATFAKLPKGVRYFDLGGGLVAFGIDGAAPNNAATVAQASATAARPLARIMLKPADALALRQRQSVTTSGQLEILRAEGIPPAVLDALIDPPHVHEILGLSRSPDELVLDLALAADGSIQAAGTLAGNIPLPARIPVPASTEQKEKVFADVFLPFSIRALFLKYIEGEMRLKTTPGLTTRQRRWSRRFDNLAEREVDLDKDLWPAVGHGFYLAIQDPTDDLNPAGYGLIRASLPFHGENIKARNAAGEIVRERWDYLFDGAAPKTIKPPYIRRVRKEESDRYILVTGQITAPSWTVTQHEVELTSDAGPFALMEQEEAAAVPSRWKKANFAEAAPYYLRLDGPRMARTVEAIASWYFGALEDEIGAHEFLDRHPNVELEMQVIKKLTRLLGTFSLELTPNADGKPAAVTAAWKPGSMAEPVAKEEDAAAPPPPKR